MSLILRPSRFTFAASFPSGLSVWARYKASSMIAVGDGNGLSQWDDISGNGRHMTQATSARQPILRTAASGLSGNTVAVEFEGDNSNPHYMDIPDMSAITQGAAFVVLKSLQSTLTSSNNRLWRTGTANDEYYTYGDNVVYDTFGAASRWPTYPRGPATDMVSVTGIDMRNWHTYGVLSETNHRRQIVSNIQYYDSTAAHTPAFTNAPRLGGYVSGTSGTRNARKQIAEIVLMNAVPTSTKFTELYNYAVAEYGI